MKVHAVIGTFVIAMGVGFAAGYLSRAYYQQPEVSVTSDNIKKVETMCANEGGLIRLVPTFIEETVNFNAFCIGGGKFSRREAYLRNS